MRNAIAAVCLALASVTVHAQPNAGDVVFSTAGTTVAGLYNIDPLGQNMATIMGGNVTAPSFPNFVAMWDDNRDMAICVTQSTGTTPSGFWRVDPIGTPTTIAGPITGSPNHIAYREDGMGFYASGVNLNAIYDIPSNSMGGYSTVVQVLAGFSNCMTLDPANGDFIVGGSTSYPAPPTPPTPGTGFLLRYDSAGQLVATLATSLLRVSGVTPDLQRGGFFVSRFDQGGILRVGPTGVVTTLLATNTRNNSVLLDTDGTLWTVDVADITHFDRAGSVIRTFTVPLSAPGLTGMTIYGSRVLTPQGVARPNQPLPINIVSQRPTEAGKPYALAASFATRPGFRLGGRWINLVVDSLFQLSAQNLAPQIFRRFAGVLDPFGMAQATLQLPAGFPANSGLRIHIQGLILDPLAPGGISSVTNMVHLTLQ